jgi:GNAT superfamily N-acetyltransferase
MQGEQQDYYWRQREHFDQFHHYFLVALHEGELVGFLQFFLQSISLGEALLPLSLGEKPLIEAKILAFAVRIAWRRQGIGRALQTQVISRARALGCYQVRSYSSYGPEHEANYQLKLAMGYSVQPAQRDSGANGAYFLLPLWPPL